MLTKMAFVQGVQHALGEAGYVNYADQNDADAQASKVAAALMADPAAIEFDLEKSAEVANALIAVNEVPTTAKQAAHQRLSAAASAIQKLAMNEGGDQAPDQAGGAGPDTNAKAKYDVAGNGDTSTPIGTGSTTGDESARPGGHAALDRMTPEGANGAGADTNAKAKYDVAGNGDSAVAERQTTGDELKVASEYGAHLDASLTPNMKVAAIRQLAQLPTKSERDALVAYVNETYGKTASTTTAVGDDDILRALAGNAQ